MLWHGKSALSNGTELVSEEMQWLSFEEQGKGVVWKSIAMA